MSGRRPYNAAAPAFKPSPLSQIIAGAGAAPFVPKNYNHKNVRANQMRNNRVNARHLLERVNAARHEPINTAENAAVAASEGLAAAAAAEQEWSSFSAEDAIEGEANRAQAAALRAQIANVEKELLARETNNAGNSLFRELNFQRALRQSYAKRNGSRKNRSNRRSSRKARKNRSNRRSTRKSRKSRKSRSSRR